jgi:DNA-binding NarL/FixJ family response regulator
MAALSVLVRPKCGQGNWATTPARSPLDSQVRLDVGLSGKVTSFRVRECSLPLMLSHLRHELLHVVHARPLVLPPSAAIVTQFVTRLQARGQTDHLLVRYAQPVGSHRWPGHLPVPRSVEAGHGPTSLWSDMVVTTPGHQVVRDPLLRRSFRATLVPVVTQFLLHASSTSRRNRERPPDRTTSVIIWLTEREMAVLRLLHGSLTLPEIAAELELSPSTIKARTGVIYRKLDVRTRRDAITRDLPVRVRPLRSASQLEPTLTKRELRVLQLLRGSLTLTEIAAELELSPNTIKTHTRAIYRKLGVHNRRDAISQGQETGILPSTIAKRHEVTCA